MAAANASLGVRSDHVRTVRQVTDVGLMVIQRYSKLHAGLWTFRNAGVPELCCPEKKLRSGRAVFRASTLFNPVIPNINNSQQPNKGDNIYEYKEHI